MRSIPLTLLLAISGFPDKKSEDFKSLTKIKPNDVTRFCFDKQGGYQQVTISNESGPKDDGQLEVIDAIAFSADEIDEQGYDRALIVRVQSTRGMDSFAAQKLGEAIEAYMDSNRASEFATAAIADLDVGQDLHGKWNTLVLLRDSGGNWIFKNLRFTSVQKSTGNTFAILRDGKMTKISAANLVSTLLDNVKFQAIMDSGHQLQDTKKAHLVRAPINKGGAYAVVADGYQTVYDDKLKVIASGQTGFTVMPAIDVDGSYKDGKVTTVSGKGGSWDIRPNIAAKNADALAKAYGATA